MQQKILIGFLMTLTLIGFIIFYWATESGRQEAARGRFRAEAMERGAELYVTHCAVCHGPAGEGKLGPALRDSLLDEAALQRIIARGVAGTAMPAMAEEEGGQLKPHQISDLVTFIKNWNQSLIEISSPPPPPVTVPAPAPAPALTPTPSPTPTPTPTPPPKVDTAALRAQGEEIFQKTAGGVGCQYCHGRDAKGTNLGPDIRGETAEEIQGALSRDPMTFIYLTEEEIEAVATYLKYLESQP